MKERICYICNNPLNYRDFETTNKGDDLELFSIWESDVVEFYCCSCKRFIKELQNGSLSLYRLLEWVGNGRLVKLKKLGLINEKDIVEMKRVKNNG